MQGKHEMTLAFIARHITCLHLRACLSHLAADRQIGDMILMAVDKLESKYVV